MLDGQVPRIQCGQSQLARKHKSAHLIGKQKLPRGRDRDERGRGRSFRESEYAPGIAGRIELLRHQHRQVLCGRVPEDGTKHSNVKAATVAHAHHRLGRDFVCNAQARRKVGEIILHVSLKVHVAKARHIDQTGTEVHPSPRTLSGHRLGKINIPSQSIVEYQFACDPKGVLAIEEPSLLPLSGIVNATCKAAELAYVAEEECG